MDAVPVRVVAVTVAVAVAVRVVAVAVRVAFIVVNTVASIRVELFLPKWDVFLRRQSRPRCREERPRLHLRK